MKNTEITADTKCCPENSGDKIFSAFYFAVYLCSSANVPLLSCYGEQQAIVSINGYTVVFCA